MREIKFRYWSAVNNMMGVLTELQLPWEQKRDGVYIMQFTGLKDSKGKEIYEGDILSVIPSGVFTEWFVVVAWDEVTAQFRSVHDEKGNGKLYDLGYFDLVEVIGNVWENPELFKEIKFSNGSTIKIGKVGKSIQLRGTKGIFVI